jgi:hypothetical protein
MARTSATVVLPTSADVVWETIGDFNRVADWHPAISASKLEESGQLRRVSVTGGGESVERLTGQGPHWYSYQLVSGPMPVSEYAATLRVEDAPEGNATVKWSASYTPEGASDADAEAAIRPFLEAGLDNLRRQFDRVPG